MFDLYEKPQACITASPSGNWHKIRKDGGSDGRGVGFYFRNVTELLLFGVRGKNSAPIGIDETAYLRSDLLEVLRFRQASWLSNAPDVSSIPMGAERVVA
jgi:hypothetical protein